MAKHAAEHVRAVLCCHATIQFHSYLTDWVWRLVVTHPGHATRPSLVDMQQGAIQAQPTAAEGLTR